MKGLETRKADAQRKASGFYDKFMSGYGLDIGFQGSGAAWGNETVLPTAKGVELGDPGYDGHNLPYSSGVFDYVFSSHCLEHVDSPVEAVIEWFRVLKEGGRLVLVVPNAYLYEKTTNINNRPWPSCPDHRRVFTPAGLLVLIEQTLAPNSYRVVHLTEHDEGYDYTIPGDLAPNYMEARFEIELVLVKRPPPAWNVRC